jgi:hypothetical protein
MFDLANPFAGEAHSTANHLQRHGLFVAEAVTQHENAAGARPELDEQ